MRQWRLRSGLQFAVRSVADARHFSESPAIGLESKPRSKPRGGRNSAIPKLPSAP